MCGSAKTVADGICETNPEDIPLANPVPAEFQDSKFENRIQQEHLPGDFLSMKQHGEGPAWVLLLICLGEAEFTQSGIHAERRSSPAAFQSISLVIARAVCVLCGATSPRGSVDSWWSVSVDGRLENGCPVGWNIPCCVTVPLSHVPILEAPSIPPRYSSEGRNGAVDNLGRRSGGCFRSSDFSLRQLGSKAGQ